MNQKDLIRSQEWDCLIILDACRYDFFERVYKDYLDGKLIKAHSPGSDTLEWLCGTFMDEETFEDVVYLSANPFVSSQGFQFIEDFDATEYFYKVINVWNWKFDLEFLTVLPEDMGKATRLARAKYPKKPIISHFIQPHWPYPSGESFKEIFTGPLAWGWIGEENKDILHRFGGFLENLFEKVFGELKTRRFKEKLNLRQSKPEEIFAEKYGKKKLRETYEKNLRLALKEVVKVVERLPEKVIVTADHGEFLGERDLYSHPPWSDDPILREVPWLEAKI